MKALIFKSKNSPLELVDIDAPQASTGEVVVDIKCAALNHRDNWITKGMYPDIRPDIILGSDACAIHNGQQVLINPNQYWGDNQRFPGTDYKILGMPGHGTFAEQIAVKQDRLVEMPEHLSPEQAAALPLGGLTAYRALFSRCNLQPSERVLISGIGGCVALFACQFALAAGAEVWVTSSSQGKIDKAVAIGASGGANYREADWSRNFKKQTGGFDVIIDSAGGEGFADLVRLTNRGARIGLYGGTAGNWLGVSPQIVFFNQIDILGSTMGSDQDFADMVNFVARTKIRPIVDSVYTLEEGNKALALMDNGEQFGKIVITT